MAHTRPFMLLVMAGLLSLSASAWAGVEEGNEAYDRGDYETALKEWRSLGEQGNAEAQYALGIMYYHGQGVSPADTEAHKRFQLAASQGHARAQTSLGIAYHHGDGVPQDYTRALTWYRLAAAQGDSLAYARLGLMYKNGEGVRRIMPRLICGSPWLRATENKKERRRLSCATSWPKR